MRKVGILLFILMSCFALYHNTPKEMIRFRIIANSNAKEDQEMKKKIVKRIAGELRNSNIHSIEEERNYIKENIPTMEEKIKALTDMPFDVKYGMNYFPEKKDEKGNYQAGFYESLVITLGEGAGDNFWCILFPPLCMVDEEETEYKSFFKEVLSKIF